jgi:hypothetical protein
MLDFVDVGAIDEKRSRKGVLSVDTIGTSGNEAAKEEAQSVMAGVSSESDR